MFSETLFEYHFQRNDGKRYCPNCLSMVKVQDDTEFCADCGAKVIDLGELRQDCLPIGYEADSPSHVRVMYREGGLQNEPLQVDEYFGNTNAACVYASLRSAWFPPDCIEVQKWECTGRSYRVIPILWWPTEVRAYDAVFKLGESVVWRIRVLAYDEGTVREFAAELAPYEIDRAVKLEIQIS